MEPRKPGRPRKEDAAPKIDEVLDQATESVTATEQEPIPQAKPGRAYLTKDGWVVPEPKEFKGLR